MKNKKETYFNLKLAQNGDEIEGKDGEYVYRVTNGVWEAKLKNSPDDDWVELSAEEVSEKKLDTTHPDAQKIVKEANLVEGNTLELNEENLKFISPDSANLFSGVGDTNIFDVLQAGVTTAKSFGKGEYYDPGKASDYRKYSFKNTSDEDMYIDEDAFNKGKRQSKVFGTKDEIAEQRIQRFLDDRNKRNPRKYAKVKDFDIEEYRNTGNVDYRQGPFNLFKSEGKQGDLFEERDNADAIGFTLDKRGKYDEPLDYRKGFYNDGTPKTYDFYDDGSIKLNTTPSMQIQDSTPILQTKPLEQIEYQSGGGNTSLGYNPLTNVYTPPNFELDPETQYNMQTLNLGDMSSPDDTRFFNSQDIMYANQQAVNRSMDDYESATEKTMDEFNNPFSIKNTQTSFDLPSSNTFEPDDSDQFSNDLFDSKDMRTPSTDEIDINDLDSGSDRRALRKYRRQLKREDRRNERAGRDSFANRAYNTANMILDSKPAQIYGKVGAGAVRLANPVNRLLEQRQERKKLKTMMDNAYLSDNVFASNSAIGNKGDYDVNTGIFRPDDKVISRQGKYGTELSNYLTFAKTGGAFFNDGGEAEIDANMYKELIAAGAELEII